MKKTHVFLLFFLMMSSVGIAQTRWVQFYLSELHSDAQCRALEASLMLQEGVESVRAVSVDHHLLVFLKPEASIVTTQLADWLRSYGFTKQCFEEGILGINPIVRMKAEDCPPMEQKE